MPVVQDDEQMRSMTRRQRVTVVRTVVTMFAAIFLVEFVVNLLLPTLFPRLGIIPLTLLDSSFLVLVLSPILYRLIVRPLQQQLRTARQREEAQARLAAIITYSEDAIIGKTLDGTITSWNAAAEQLFGYTETEAIGQPLAIIFPPERAGELADILAHSKRGEPIARYETVRMRKGGRRVAVSVTISPVKDAEGRLIGTSTITHDISARKAAETERAHALAELEATFAAMVNAVIIYGPQLEILRINPAAERILGYSSAVEQREYAERLTPLQFESPSGHPVPVEALTPWRAVHGETIHDEIFRFHRQDGRLIWIAASGAPIRTSDGRLLGAVVTFSDITAFQELQEQQQMILHTVSHDLRTPLAVIQGHIQLLEETARQRGQNGAMQESIAAIIRATRRMGTMIADLVDAARMEGGQLQLRKKPILLQHFLPALLRRLQPVLEVPRFQLDLSDDLPPVVADPDRLERILTNLLSNALKYSTPGTPVRVSAQVQEHMVCVSVADQGPGIASDDLPHLFDRFYRAKRTQKAEGLGLGLYITRVLVEAHGGQITVESEEGHGSTFTFTLPRSTVD